MEGPGRVQVKRICKLSLASDSGGALGAVGLEIPFAVIGIFLCLPLRYLAGGPRSIVTNADAINPGVVGLAARTEDTHNIAVFDGAGGRHIANVIQNEGFKAVVAELAATVAGFFHGFEP
jgi:hypothetical protein